jgi:dihydrodipicolinate reductase
LDQRERERETERETDRQTVRERQRESNGRHTVVFGSYRVMGRHTVVFEPDRERVKGDIWWCLGPTGR